MQFEYKPKGVCSSEILMEIDDNDHTLQQVKFIGGCNGNLSGIAKLVTGMKAEDVIERLKGTTCGHKNTSCPDQFSNALEAALQQLKSGR